MLYLERKAIAKLRTFTNKESFLPHGLSRSVWKESYTVVFLKYRGWAGSKWLITTVDWCPDLAILSNVQANFTQSTQTP